MYNKKVSIIMGVFNCENTISQAIESILNQTYTNWELIICDDASTDNTLGVIKRYAKKHQEKIIVIQHNENRKLAICLNDCLNLASGYYIARMDGDDISLPNRLEIQVDFLENNHKYELCGLSMQRFDDNGYLGKIDNPPEYPNKYTILVRTPFNHATVMAKKEVFDKLGGYTSDKYTCRCEDKDLWFRFFSNNFKGANVLKPLYMVRENDAAIRRRDIKDRWARYVIYLRGYKMISAPWYGYILITLETILKICTPCFVYKGYRKWQNKNFK